VQLVCDRLMLSANVQVQANKDQRQLQSTHQHIQKLVHRSSGAGECCRGTVRFDLNADSGKGSVHPR
jgi:hypothetical protein